MAQGIGQQIEKLRNKMVMSQTDFGKLFRVTPMSVSRWEHDVNLPESRELLKLGLLWRSGSARTRGCSGSSPGSRGRMRGRC